MIITMEEICEISERMREIERSAGLTGWTVPCADTHLAVVAASADPEDELAWYADFCHTLAAVDAAYREGRLTASDIDRLADKLGDWDAWMAIAKSICSTRPPAQPWDGAHRPIGIRRNV